MAQQPPVGQGFLIIEASRSHSDTPHSVRLLLTSDKPGAETSTLQTKHSKQTEIHATGRDSNPKSMQTSGRKRMSFIFIRTLKGTEDRTVHRVLKVRRVHRGRQ